MSTFKKLALSLLLAMPMVASAAGMGVYIPVSISESADITLDSDYGSEDLNFEYKAAAGFGVAFDSNIGKDKLFNYRLGLEYMNQEIDTVDGESCTGDCDFTRLNMVHTFGFGVLRTQTVRLWVGPRINLAYNSHEETYANETFTMSHFEFGVAPAVGVNVNLGRLVSLGADLDYRFAGLAGAWSYEDNFDSEDNSYSGGVTGATARFYVMFRFGETFDTAARPAADQGVVDQSL